MKTLLLFGAIALSVNVFAQVPNYVPTNGLVGWWGFNANANDESGNGNNGNPIGAVLDEDRYGNPNSSYSFSSGADLICTSNSFSSPNVLTYSVWIKTLNPGHIIGFNNGQCAHGGAWDRALIINSSNVTFYTYSGGQVFHNAPISIMDGEWHHVIVTLDPTGSNIYVDGNLASTNPSQNIGQGNTGYFRFGGLSPNDLNNSMIGTFDDIGIWNRALTECEIQELYNAEILSVSNSVAQVGAQLTADLTGATYQWLDCDNNYYALIGATNQTYTPPATGNYAVEVTLNGCVDTSACMLVDFTGIEELFSGEKVLIKVTDLMGRETKFTPNTPLIYIYSDGTIERVFKIEE